MKFRKSLLVICSLVIISLALIGASEPEKSINPKSPIVIGEILAIEKSEDNKSIRITVEGYIKDKEVNKIKVVGIIDDTTKVMNSSNDKKDNIELQKGDLVYMRVSEAMTKSNPPQTIVKRIFVTKNK
ncbi:MAG: hypothetical protein MR510_12675 [Clostridium sp.]|jgi:hypothetical protein|uniref:hypothetical protein n=1 Tax=Clostridium sp. TaxID=1506 RepID=UPI0025BC84CE|nr:hypothetical protein [Clostridium sp.]MCI6693312.1 hypothetical protein [Clostridium sp.]MDY2632652.1 hypothetical protein [Clostridium sp.]